MSLDGKQFQVVDTMDIRAIIKNPDGSTKTIFTGETSKSTLDAKADKIEVYSGIGQNKTFELYTKKQMSIDVLINAFDIEFLAYKNGVQIDKTSKGTFYIGKSVTVTTNSATINNVKRIITVKNPTTNKELKIVTGTPASADEVKVAISSGNATLTFHTSYGVSSAIVTYEGDAATGKDNYTINFYGNAFPSTVELLGNTVVYDEQTENIVADLYLDLYQAVGDPEFSLSFEMGKPVEVPVKFDILVPTTLPDGTANTNKAIGKMVITER